MHRNPPPSYKEATQNTPKELPPMYNLPYAPPRYNSETGEPRTEADINQNNINVTPITTSQFVGTTVATVAFLVAAGTGCTIS